MSDNSLVDGSYVLHRPFYVPTEHGAVWAVAFTTKGGTNLTAGISVFLTLIFVCLWDLICFIAMVFPGSATRRRHLALVTIWNSNDSLFAFEELAKYAYHFLGAGSDFTYGLIFCILAFIIYGGSMSLGIVGPGLLQVGTVAPAQPSQVFYPALQSDDPTNLLQNFGTRVPAYLRALGSVDASLGGLEDSVNVYEDTSVDLGSSGGDPIKRYYYTYALTGIDLGLQHGSDLALNVTGSCITEYDWYSSSKSTSSYDIYNIWNQQVTVPITPEAIIDPPQTTFMSNPNATAQLLNSGNVSFAIVAWSAHRASIKQGGDPWYETETRDATYAAPYNASFWVKRARPALSCWQHDSWTYGDENVTSVYDLKNLKGIKIKPILLSILEQSLAAPALYTLGDSVSHSALKSATTSLNGVLNAEVTTIEDDLQRLVLASFAFSRNVFLDTTRYQLPQGLGNLLVDSKNKPIDGAGDFVLSSPDFQTFSLVGLIVIFVVLFVLLGLNFLMHRLLRFYAGKANNNGAKEKMMLFKALPAAQLFRRIHEDPGANEKSDFWPCTDEFPSKEHEIHFKMGKCSESECNGHINGKLPDVIETPLVVEETGTKTKEVVHEDTQSAISPLS